MVGGIFRIPYAWRVYTYTHSGSSHYDPDQIDQWTKSSQIEISISLKYT